MVSEDEFIVAMMCALLFGAWTIYLLLRNRALKKRLEREETRSGAILSAMRQAPLPQPAARDDEVSELRKRVQVLERITVEKEHSLSREIEALRQAG